MAIQISRQGSATIKTTSPPPSLKSQSRWGQAGLFKRSVKRSELLFFASQLSLMLGIGTPINLAVRAIKDQTENRNFRKVLNQIHLDLEEGRQLSDAMRHHSRIFNKVFVSLVKAGETGGFLKEILDRLCEIQEKQQALMTELRSAMTYPVILCITSLLVIVFIIVGVLPKFTHFFIGKENILPFTTRSLMFLSGFLKEYWWLVILLAGALVAGVKLFLGSRKGKAFIDYVLVSAPVLASLMNKIYTNQLLRTLGHLMDSHVPLLESLEVTRATVRNRYFRDFVDNIADHVREGGRLSKPFSKNPYLLESVKQMVFTGEETGNLPKVMLYLADFYDTEVDRELKIFSSMIQPAALIVMGGVIGLIVSSVILPLFKLAGAMQ